MNNYDIIIIGAGISGIMLAYRLLQKNKSLNMILIDKGAYISKRKCPIMLKVSNNCLNCKPCSVMCGFAGAGAYSDGKFIISTEYGGELPSVIGEEKALYYMNMADSILKKFSKVKKIYEPNNELLELCSRNQLQLKKGIVKHFGTENNIIIMEKLLEEIKEKCIFLENSNVIDVKVENMEVILENSKKIKGKKIIFAVGRSGNKFLQTWCEKNNVEISSNNVDIGVRVELKNEIWEKISSVVYVPIISYITKEYNDEVRMFCFNQGGEVVIENTFGGLTVNGHAYSDNNLKTENSNFALLSGAKFSLPFCNPNEYILNLVKCSNIISGNNVILQRFGDLVRGKRSTVESLKSSSIKPTLHAYPGDLSLCMPKRQLDNIIETIYKLNDIALGTSHDDTLLYGIEAKYYSSVPKMKNFKINNLSNIYACGDGCGITRSLAQAAANGLFLADIII